MPLPLARTLAAPTLAAALLALCALPGTAPTAVAAPAPAAAPSPGRAALGAVAVTVPTDLAWAPFDRPQSVSVDRKSVV